MFISSPVLVCVVWHRVVLISAALGWLACLLLSTCGLPSCVVDSCCVVGCHPLPCNAWWISICKPHRSCVLFLHGGLSVHALGACRGDFTPVAHDGNLCKPSWLLKVKRSRTEINVKSEAILYKFGRTSIISVSFFSHFLQLEYVTRQA